LCVFKRAGRPLLSRGRAIVGREDREYTGDRRLLVLRVRATASPGGKERDRELRRRTDRPNDALLADAANALNALAAPNPQNKN
jgi:hypothetical protein